MIATGIYGNGGGTPTPGSVGQRGYALKQWGLFYIEGDRGLIVSEIPGWLGLPAIAEAMELFYGDVSALLGTTKA